MGQRGLRRPAGGWEPRVAAAIRALGPAAPEGRERAGASGALAVELAPVASAASDAAEPIASLGRIAMLLDLVVEWNARIDLTAARGADELVDLFVADAWIAARGSRELDGAWVDVGAGAGAPGVVLSLIVPGLAMTLVEPRAKRAAFLRTAVGALGLESARVERARSDSIEPGRFAAAVSRATLPPAEWLAEGTRLATREVWVLLARQAAPRADGWLADDEIEYAWPLTGAPRRAVRYVPARATEDGEAVQGR